MQLYVSNCLNGRKYFLNGMGTRAAETAYLAPQLLNAAAGVGALQLHVVAMGLQPGQDFLELAYGLLGLPQGRIQLGFGEQAGNLGGISRICLVPVGEGLVVLSCPSAQISRQGQNASDFPGGARELFSCINTLVVGSFLTLPINSRLRTTAVMSIEPNPR